MRPPWSHAADVTDLDHETVAEYVESRDFDAHFERTDERVLLVVM